MSKDHVTSFYSRLFGWNMFDAKLLTPELEQFLTEEARMLDMICQEKPAGLLLIEAGCGYGRYMQWALSRSFSYLGCDLVPWLVDIGQLRLEAMKIQYSHQSASLHNLPLERLAEILPPSESCVPSLVFLPFNCFGNISNVIAAMETLSICTDEVFISTFCTNAETSAIREAYYANCGYCNLNSFQTSIGTVITSQEGLHAIAYSEDYLKKLFSSYGFHLDNTMQYGKIGIGYHFRQTRQQPKVRNLFEDQSLANLTGRPLPVPVTISVLQDKPGQSATGELLSFENYDALLVCVSPHEMVLECTQTWEPGRIVKLEFVLPSGRPDEVEEHIMVAIIKSASQRQNGISRVALEPYQNQFSLWPLLMKHSLQRGYVAS